MHIKWRVNKKHTCWGSWAFSQGTCVLLLKIAQPNVFDVTVETSVHDPKQKKIYISPYLATVNSNQAHKNTVARDHFIAAPKWNTETATIS